MRWDLKNFQPKARLPNIYTYPESNNKPGLFLRQLPKGTVPFGISHSAINEKLSHQFGPA
jgi:hypothetical protein